jgi:hypothetical protein
MLWVLSHKRECTVAKKKTGSASKQTFKFYKSGSVPHKSPSEETHPKDNVVTNISKINDVQSFSINCCRVLVILSGVYIMASGSGKHRR